jgi:THO complex subunit 3
LSTHQQEAPFNHVAFCFSGQRIFVALESGKVRVLGYPSLEPLMHLPPGSSGGGDGGDMAGASAEFTLDGHTWSCLSAEMQPTARYLATGGADSLIAFWDTAEWLCLRTSTSMVGAVRSLSRCSSFLV